MAFAKDYPTRIDEVFNFVNNDLTKRIQNRVEWNIDNVDTNFRYAFNRNNDLPRLGSEIKPGDTMKIEELYNQVKRIAYYWSAIRRVHLVIKYHNSDDGNHWYDTRKDETRIGRVTDNYRDGGYTDSLRQEFTALKDKPLYAQQLKDLLNKFYTKWEQLPTIELYHELCHSSCHSSCHHR